MQRLISRADVADAARIMAALALVTAFGHVSARAGDRILITPAADLHDIGAEDIIEVPLDAGTLPAGATSPAATSPAATSPAGAPRPAGAPPPTGATPPASGALPQGAAAETWLHLAIYRARPDVDSIARAQPPSAFAAAAMGRPLRPLHGQAAWLGRVVPVHDDARLLRSFELAAVAAGAFTEGEALLLRGNGAATTGETPGLAVARMWLLSAACTVWTAAGPDAIALSNVEVDAWRATSAELLPRLWQHLRRVGLAQSERPA